MKKEKKDLFFAFGTLLTSFAFWITALNVNTTCVLIAHQSKLPEDSKKLRKF